MNGDNFFKKSKLGLAISGKVCYSIKVDTRDTHHPGVAQLVARLTGGQEAVSSSLATRTKGQVLIGLALFSFPEFSRCTELCIFRYPFLLLVEGLIPYYIAGGSI